MKSLEAIKKRLEAATKGPWSGFERGSWGGEGFGVSTDPDKVDEWFTAPADTETAANNSVFIAHSRTDIERLVSALEKAIEQRDKMFEDISTITRKPIEEMIAEDNQELESILRGQS